MRLSDALKLVFRSIVSSPLRSGLTALGIAIGIAAVVLLTAIGEGVRFYVLDNFSQFGTRIMAVHPGKTLTQGMGGILSTTRPLSLDDAESLYTLPNIEAIAPIVQGVGAIEYGEKARNSDIIGAGYQTAKAWNFKLAMGRFLPEDQMGHSRAYAVLGHKVKQELFGTESPLGKLIRVGGQRFRVIGVIEKKGQMLGFDLDDIVYIPIDKAMQLFNREGLMEINIVFTAAMTSTQAMDRVTKHLVARHGSEDFTITSQDQMLNSLDSILAVLTLSVGALGAISLLVGGVGILTIMSTTVRERTGEIGLLRALGSTRQQVMLLFLAEAAALGMVGGISGLLLMSIIVVAVTVAMPALPVLVSPFYVLLSLLLSLVIGLIAGVVPARQAALLNPIDALRTE